MHNDKRATVSVIIVIPLPVIFKVVVFSVNIAQVVLTPFMNRYNELGLFYFNINVFYRVAFLSCANLTCCFLLNIADIIAAKAGVTLRTRWSIPYFNFRCRSLSLRILIKCYCKFWCTVKISDRPPHRVRAWHRSRKTVDLPNNLNILLCIMSM